MTMLKLGWAITRRERGGTEADAFITCSPFPHKRAGARFDIKGPPEDGDIDLSL